MRTTAILKDGTTITTTEKVELGKKIEGLMRDENGKLYYKSGIVVEILEEKEDWEG